MSQVHFIDRWIGVAIHQVQKFWFPPLLGLLAGLDNFLFVIPTDGLLIAAVIAAPKRALAMVLWCAAGSVGGAYAFAEAVYQFGPQVLDWVLGDSLQTSSAWKWSQEWFSQYGTWAVFGIAALPLIHHPILSMAILAKVPSQSIAGAMLAGRLLKYSLMAIVAVRAPELLKKIKPIRDEMKEVEEDQKK